MVRRWPTRLVCIVSLAILLAGCSDPTTPPDRDENIPPTPSQDVLLVSHTTANDARLRITLPSIKLLQPEVEEEAQFFLALVDEGGPHTYLLYPANRSGDRRAEVDLTRYPLELSLREDAKRLTLWLLAVHNTQYGAAERFGLDSLAQTLAAGFGNWLAAGSREDDPLAAVVRDSEGALYEWFASTEVLGQAMATFESDEDWNVGLTSIRSPDGGLSAVYTVQYISAEDAALIPTPTPTFDTATRSGYVLTVDETFPDGVSTQNWYQGQDSTYINRVTNGACEIHLTEISERDYGLSWGSMEGERFTDYILEAHVRLVEDDVEDARYGIWFNYQDDYNFLYFGISNRGEYRVARIQSNSNRHEIQDWTHHPAVRAGAAINVLTIEARPDQMYVLSVNGDEVLRFSDDTFAEGSLAFFCYAESVPATCRLERLRIWERAE
jgi:hypothetical protein